MTQLQALIVDDEEELRKSVISILKNLNLGVEFQFDEAASGLEAVQKVRNHTYDFVLMDVRMPELNGLEALAEIKDHDPRTFIVIMTAHSNLQDAVQAIKDGAYDYLEKPVKPEVLSAMVKKALEAREMVSSLAISNPIFDDDIESEFVGQNHKMKEVFNLIYKLCKVDTTVLIRGENGTGKELVAKAIHFNSPRKNGQFVAINCGAIPENLMESEFFGHEKGAFTGASERKIGKFQAANNGTIFLDEIGELRPEMQVKLLRVLQERKFVPVGSTREVKTNTRIVAATNRNLEKMMEEGTFREDLFYRLNVMPIFLPPLRDRVEDIPALSQYFIKKFSKVHDSPIQGIAPEAIDVLKKYTWPGNIRELENAVERAFIVESGSLIKVESLPDSIRTKVLGTVNPNAPRKPLDSADLSKASLAQGNPAGLPLDFDIFKEGMEKDFIVSALKANKGRINQTVAQANIPKNTLLRKIKKYGINVKDYSEE
ncbi:MAG: sigma-54 dependent transcriptional regulator [Bdellovibrionota bacterium]